MDTNIRTFGETAKSYYEIRMSELGVNEENNIITLNDPEADFPRNPTISKPIFSEDSEGNIQILYYTLDRELITYVQKGEGKTANINAKDRYYFQTRLKNPSGDKKYVLPKGQPTYPFLPLPIVEKWERKEMIETLVITEGAFKAFIGARLGIDVVGLPSITCYKDKETGRLHRDIERIIQDCKVKNVVILWDGDCLNISDSDLEFNLELTRRPQNFINAAKAIQELVLKIEMEHPLSIFFAHVNSAGIPNNPKGLDDLLIQFDDSPNEIISELGNLSDKQGHFFKIMDISKSVTQLYNYFKLNDVQVFYNHHTEKIGDNTFKFKGSVYKFNDIIGELKLITPDWASKLFWIGDEFFKLVEQVDIEGIKDYDEENPIQRTQLVKREYTTLRRNYGKEFEKFVKYYEGFCNIPSHFDYKQSIRNFYNRYAPFIHKAEIGDCPHSLAFVKHIFGTRLVEHNGQSISQYELGLDYLQLLLVEPMQKLPVLILYSKNNNTGKSLFGKWLQYIFQQNCVFISTQIFESEFNEFWVDKLLIICEETLLEKAAATEKIKAFSTGGKVPVNPKGQKQFNLDFFGKFQFYTNQEKMIYLTKYDERFWILDIPTPKYDDPYLLEKLKDELPAFLYFIKNRKVVTENVGRMHFHANLLKNESFYRTVRLNEPKEARELRERLKEIFLDFEQDEILMTIQDIDYEFFKDKLGRTYLQRILKEYLNVSVKLGEQGKPKPIRYHYFMHSGIPDLTGDIPKRKEEKIGRPYVFKRADFVPEEEDYFDIIKSNP